MKKKIIAGILTGVLALGMLTGCGGGSESASSSGGSSEGTEQEAASDSEGGAEGGASVTLIMSSRDEFLSTLEAGALSAAEEAGISLTTQDAQNDQSKLLQYVETAKNNGNDAVIINLVDADAANAAVEAAGDMKVVFVNRRP